VRFCGGRKENESCAKKPSNPVIFVVTVINNIEAISNERASIINRSNYDKFRRMSEVDDLIPIVKEQFLTAFSEM
jgi:hypothetical protein